MPLRSDVEQLRDQTLGGLTAAYDHHAYSRTLWRSLELEGARGAADQVLLGNAMTGSRLTAAGLIPIVRESLDNYLPVATVQQFTSLTEAFVADLFRLWLTAYPYHLDGKVEAAAVVAASDKAAIVQTLVEAFVVGVMYKPPRDWFRRLNAVVSLGAPTDVQIDALVEVKATRDVFVHNRGFVSGLYVEKAGPLARGAVGEPLDLPDPYLHDAWQACAAIVSGVGTAAAARA